MSDTADEGMEGGAHEALGSRSFLDEFDKNVLPVARTPAVNIDLSPGDAFLSPAAPTCSEMANAEAY